MSILAPINPAYTQGQIVAAAAVAASVSVNKAAKQIAVTNLGSNIAYVRTGTGTIAATTADMPVYPGEAVYIEKPQDDDTVATISAAGTTASIMSGEGGF